MAINFLITSNAVLTTVKMTIPIKTLGAWLPLRQDFSTMLLSYKERYLVRRSVYPAASGGRWGRAVSPMGSHPNSRTFLLLSRRQKSSCTTPLHQTSTPTFAPQKLYPPKRRMYSPSFQMYPPMSDINFPTPQWFDVTPFGFFSPGPKYAPTLQGLFPTPYEFAPTPFGSILSSPKYAPLFPGVTPTPYEFAPTPFGSILSSPKYAPLFPGVTPTPYEFAPTPFGPIIPSPKYAPLFPGVTPTPYEFAPTPFGPILSSPKYAPLFPEVTPTDQEFFPPPLDYFPLAPQFAPPVFESFHSPFGQFPPLPSPSPIDFLPRKGLNAPTPLEYFSPQQFYPPTSEFFDSSQDLVNPEQMEVPTPGTTPLVLVYGDQHMDSDVIIKRVDADLEDGSEVPVIYATPALLGRRGYLSLASSYDSDSVVHTEEVDEEMSPSLSFQGINKIENNPYKMARMPRTDTTKPFPNLSSYLSEIMRDEDDLFEKGMRKLIAPNNRIDGRKGTFFRKLTRGHVESPIDEMPDNPDMSIDTSDFDPLTPKHEDVTLEDILRGEQGPLSSELQSANEDPIVNLKRRRPPLIFPQDGFTTVPSDNLEPPRHESLIPFLAGLPFLESSEFEKAPSSELEPPTEDAPERFELPLPTEADPVSRLVSSGELELPKPTSLKEVELGEFSAKEEETKVPSSLLKLPTEEPLPVFDTRFLSSSQFDREESRRSAALLLALARGLGLKEYS